MTKPFRLPALAVALALACPAASAVAQAPASAAALYPVPAEETAAAAAHAAVLTAAKQLAKLSRGALGAAGSLKLGGSAPGPGTFSFLLTARIHGKTVVIGRGSKTVGSAGALSVKLTLTKAGKAALAGAKGKLKLKVTVAATFKPTHGKATTAKGTATLR